MPKYRLYTYDLWGNARDGYQVNDVFKSDTVIDITDDMTDKQIFKAIGIKPQSQNHVEFDNNSMSEHSLYIQAKKDSRPICELRLLPTCIECGHAGEGIDFEHEPTSDICINEMESAGINEEIINFWRDKDN